jgi:hypothetical protein
MTKKFYYLELVEIESLKNDVFILYDNNSLISLKISLKDKITRNDISTSLRSALKNDKVQKEDATFFIDSKKFQIKKAEESTITSLQREGFHLEDKENFFFLNQGEKLNFDNINQIITEFESTQDGNEKEAKRSIVLDLIKNELRPHIDKFIEKKEEDSLKNNRKEEKIQEDQLIIQENIENQLFSKYSDLIQIKIVELNEKNFLSDDELSNFKNDYETIFRLFKQRLDIDQEVGLADEIEVDKNLRISEAMITFEGSMKGIEKRINSIINKRKKKAILAAEVKEEIDQQLYEMFFINANLHNEKERIYTTLRLKITYTLLYYLGTSATELMFFTEKDIHHLIETREVIIIDAKSNKSNQLFISQQGRETLEKIMPEIKRFFSAHHFLGSITTKTQRERKTMSFRFFTALVNEDIKKTLEIINPMNSLRLTTHSFRIGFITKLLKNNDPDIVEEITKHKAINKGLKYQLDLTDILNILDEAFNQTN